MLEATEQHKRSLFHRSKRETEAWERARVVTRRQMTVEIASKKISFIATKNITERVKLQNH